MQLTKFGHSCVLLDDGQTTLLFDPGMWSSIPDITVDGIIITHIHQDHVDIPNVKVLLERKADVRIITNSEVKAELDKHGIVSEAVEEGGSINIGTFLIEAYGNNHAVIHPDFPTFQNTGYLINETVFHPGDALVVPGKPVTTLLLPVVAPWSKIAETLDYITTVKAGTYIPIHDGFLAFPGPYYGLPKQWVEKINARFVEVENGISYEI